MDRTIVDYLSEQRASFNSIPLNDVDSLIFSTIAYFSFENGVLERTIPAELVALPVAVCGISREDLYGGVWLSRMGGDDFLSALLASPRFMNSKVGFYIRESSSHFEKQFSAITFYLPNDSAYIAFRGTDNSLAGWKENFNLTFMEAVPSQLSARSYLEDIASAGVQKVYVGGHSKGGNLAEYAALTCRNQTFDKIIRVFNHDGPGFAFTPSDRVPSEAYRTKLRKTVPESSVFGMLMETRPCYRVVSASGFLFAQHASTHWRVEDNDFVTASEITPEAAIISNTLTTWANSYEPEKRELFIDAGYNLFCAANAETWAQFGENPASNALAVAEATAKLPPDMRATFFSMIRDIAPIVSSEAAQRVRQDSRRARSHPHKADSSQPKADS